MVSGPRWRADVARRTTARMRRGTEATWQGRRWPHEAQAAHTARTRGRRPRVSTQVHADARVGLHVAMGVGIWRAHGLVGPGKKFGAVTQVRYSAPIFILIIFRYFFRVGLCPTHVLPFAGDVDARRASDSVRMAEIAWTRVHAIIKSGTCAKHI